VGMNREGQGDASRAAARGHAPRRLRRIWAVGRSRPTSCICVALVAAALSCALPVQGATIGPRASSGRLPAAEIARRARKAKSHCPRGHVRLALRGPRLIAAQRPEPYLVLARACAHGLRRVRISVRGPQRISWLVARLRASATAHKRVKLAFPALVNANSPTFVIVTLEARSHRGKLLGRSHVKIVYREGPPRAPLPPGGVTVGWGVNFDGETGAGFRSFALTLPVQGLLRGVRQVAAGFVAGFALLNDGTVRAWGANEAGQLGDGMRKVGATSPVSVTGLNHVVQIATSGDHVLALLENGTVYTWGGDFWGNLGNGTRDTTEGVAHPIPQQVPGLEGVVAVAAGGGDDLAILSNGTVVGWGEDKNGQLGDGSTATKLVPTPVENLVGVRAVAIGGVPSLGAHMLALLNDGRVEVAGQNDHGQLGLGDTKDRHTPVLLPGVENVTSVSASESHSLVALSSGAVMSWGADGDGELGYPAPQTCNTAPCSMSPHPVAVANVSMVSAGEQFSAALSGGRVLTWGDNERGQLGDGITSQSTTPVEATGISGITQIDASEKFTLALAELGPAPDFSLRSAPGALIAEWTPLPGPEPWAVSWRLEARPPLAWGKPVIVPATAHSYAITGLNKALYEVRRTRLNTPSLGPRIAFGIPE
jgi:alpha-tubulin suppressor-like RCC1 family protein